jgi:hypothetical protein
MDKAGVSAQGVTGGFAMACMHECSVAEVNAGKGSPISRAKREGKALHKGGHTAASALHVVDAGGAIHA